MGAFNQVNRDKSAKLAEKLRRIKPYQETNVMITITGSTCTFGKYLTNDFGINITYTNAGLGQHQFNFPTGFFTDTSNINVTFNISSTADAQFFNGVENSLITSTSALTIYLANNAGTPADPNGLTGLLTIRKYFV